MIRNYLGFPRGVSGMRLAQRARNQALRFGTRFHTGWEVEELVAGVDGAPHLLRGADFEVQARTVVVASGVRYRHLGVPAVEELLGRGVNYGAAMSLSREMEDQDVVVVGGGNSAGQAAVHLARYARSVTIVVRRPTLAETMSAYLVGEVEYNPRITVAPCTRVVDAGGEARLEWLTLESTETGERRRHEARGLFLLLGAEPHCAWLPEAVARDERGFVLTGRDVPKDRWVDGLPPENLATSAPGIFAAGDVRSGSMKRVAAATGEGASVVPLVHAYLARLRPDAGAPARKAPPRRRRRRAAGDHPDDEGDDPVLDRDPLRTLDRGQTVLRGWLLATGQGRGPEHGAGGEVRPGRGPAAMRRRGVAQGTERLRGAVVEDEGEPVARDDLRVDDPGELDPPDLHEDEVQGVGVQHHPPTPEHDGRQGDEREVGSTEQHRVLERHGPARRQSALGYGTESSVRRSTRVRMLRR